MVRKTSHVIALFMLVLSSLFWIGCTGDQDKDLHAKAASLPVLPQEDVAKLKPVPREQMLATSEVHLASDVAPDGGIAHPNCTTDEVETDYSAEVFYPMTVCTVLSGGIGKFTSGDAAPTHKLDYAALSPEQQAAFGNPQPLPGTIYWCRQSKGPWQGALSSDHLCSGTCDTQNRLTLTNAPNLVIFTWTGEIQNHPSYFEFDGALKLLGTAILDRCHPDTQPHAAMNKR